MDESGKQVHESGQSPVRLSSTESAEGDASTLEQQPQGQEQNAVQDEPEQAVANFVEADNDVDETKNDNIDSTDDNQVSNAATEGPLDIEMATPDSGPNEHIPVTNTAEAVSSTNALNQYLEESVSFAKDAENDELNSVSAFFKVSVATLKANSDLLHSLSVRLTDIEKIKTENQLLELNYERLQSQSKKKLEFLSDQLKISEKAVSDLRNKEASFEQEKKLFQDRLADVNKSKSSNDNTITQLKSKIESLNASKETNSQLLEIKQQEIINLTEEIKAVANDNNILRKRMMEIETGVEATKVELWTAKSEISKYERELRSMKESSTWLENELKTKVGLLETLRSEKNSKILSLQTKLEQLEQEYKLAKTSSENYSKSLVELSLKSERSLYDVKDLSDKLAIQETQFMEKIGKRDELIQVLEKSNKDKRERIDSLEKTYRETLEKVKKDELEYKGQNDNLFKELSRRDMKIEELQKMVDDLSNTGTIDSSGLQISLSPSAQKTLKEMNSYSLTDLISEINELKKEVVKERRAKSKAESELESVFKELDQRMPILQSYKDKCNDFEEKQRKMTIILDSLTKENSSLLKKQNSAAKRIRELQTQSTLLNKYKTDLQRQVVVLLSELQFRTNGELPLTIDEKKYINKIVTAYGEIDNVDSTDTDSLITNRLSTFDNVTELIKQNENLLKVSRKLGEELELKDKSNNVDDHDEFKDVENETIQKAKNAILKLQTQLKTTETQLQAITNSRDALQDMVNSKSFASDKSDVEAMNERILNLQNELKKKKEELENLKSKFDKKIDILNTRIQVLVSEKGDLSLQLTKEKSNEDLLSEKYHRLQSNLDIITEEKKQLILFNGKLQDRIKYFEDKLLNINSSLVQSSTSMAEFEIQIKGLNVEKEIWKTTEAQLRQDIQKLHEEKVQSNVLIIKLETINSERQTHFKETLQRYTNNVDALQKDVDQLRIKLERSYNETQSVLHSKNADSKAYQTRIDLLQAQLDSFKEADSSKTSQIEELTTKVQELKNKCGDLDDKKHSRLSVISNTTGSSDDIENLKRELADTIEDLDIANRDATQYKELSIAGEKQLSSLNETFEHYKVSAEERIGNFVKEVEELNEKVKHLELERDTLNSEYENLKYDTSVKEQELTSKLVNLNSTIEGFEEVKRNYEEKFNVIKSDLLLKEGQLEQLKLEIDNKDKQYQEMEQNKSSVEAEVETLQNSLAKITDELNQVKSLHESELTKWNSEKTRYEEECIANKIRISELDTQNRTLINQFEESPLNLNDTDDMKGLVTYLTRERDSLSQQLDYAKNEEKTLRHHVTNKDQELSLLKIELGTLKKKTEVLDKYSKRLEELKSELNEMQVYKENNLQLRNQIVSLEKTINDLQSKSESLTIPLQTRIEELNAELIKRDEILALANSEIVKLREKQSDFEANRSNIEQQLTTKIKELDDLNDKFEKMKTLSRERYKKLKDENVLVMNEKVKLEAQLAEFEQSNGKSNDNAEEIGKIRIQMRSLKNQLHDKEREKDELNAKSKEEIKKLNDELAQIKNSNKDGQTDISVLRAQFEKEKEDALKELELKLKTEGNASTDVDVNAIKADIELQWKKRLNDEIEAAKAQQLSKASKILERRKQEYKLKEKEYEDKIHSLELQIKEATSKKASINDNGDLIEKFEAEKAELIEKCEQDKEKILREKKLKETLMQKKVDVYERKLKDLENKLDQEGGLVQKEAPKTAVFGQPVLNASTNIPIFGQPAINSAPVFGKPLNAANTGGFNFNAAAKTATPFQVNKTPTKPSNSAKRPLEESKEGEEKRSKL